MRWQWAARVVAAVVGLACAGAIFVYTRSRPAPPAPVRSLAGANPEASFEGRAGNTLILRTGRSNVRIHYDALVQEKDGSAVYQNVVIEGLEEARFVVRADRLTTRSKDPGDPRPAFYELTSNFVLETDDGLRLESASATYDDAGRLLTIPGPLTYRRGRLSGRAVGATYDQELDAITLASEAVAHVEPDAAGKGAADATSSRMTLVRGQHMVRLDGQARIVNQTETLTGNEATITFTDDEQAVKYLELRGAARVQPNPGRGAANRAEMSGDNITMSFRPDGVSMQGATVTGRASIRLGGEPARTVSASWISLALAADGETLTRLDARDKVIVDLAAAGQTPRRTITAMSLTATGGDKGLSEARFEGNPRFDQQDRSGSAARLILTLGGALDAIQHADFQEKAVFRSGDLTARGDRAVFEEQTKELRLTPGDSKTRSISVVETPDVDVNGLTITVATEREDIAASGQVTTRFKASKDRDKSSRGLFDGSQELVGTSDTFDYVKATGEARFGGKPKLPATLRQGKSEVLAPSIRLVESTRNLTAEGGVRSAWEFETGGSDGGKAGMKLHRIAADSLVYDDASRTATYRGGPVTVTSPDGTIEADRAVFRLAAESRRLESLQAEADTPGEFRVFAVLPGGHKAAGDRLTYDAATDTYVLEGKSARLLAAPDKGATPAAAGGEQCSLRTSARMTLTKGTIASADTGAPQAVVQVSCAYDVRRAR
jgi:lipopolysaccharide export system protein LptA